VSEKHANFIVNPHGKGSAADVEALIAYVRETVLDRTGVKLEPEVRVIGETAAPGMPRVQGSAANERKWNAQ
jgi:UDP-N-acetylmuramate dehydrogenase